MNGSGALAGLDSAPGNQEAGMPPAAVEPEVAAPTALGTEQPRTEAHVQAAETADAVWEEGRCQ